MGDTAQVCANCGEPGTHQRDEWGICLADTAQSQVPTGGFVFRADNGDWYAVNADGEQSPSFRTERRAAAYLRGSDGKEDR